MIPEFVAVIALTYVRLSELARSLRDTEGVKSVETAMAARRYSSGDRIEWYVDAVVASGNSVGWWLEIRLEADTWVIEASVRHNTEFGEDELLGIETRRANGDAALIAGIDAASAQLVAAGRGLDLAAL
jgi:hypothetical protein